MKERLVDKPHRVQGGGQLRAVSGIAARQHIHLDAGSTESAHSLAAEVGDGVGEADNNACHAGGEESSHSLSLAAESLVSGLEVEVGWRLWSERRGGEEGGRRPERAHPSHPLRRPWRAPRPAPLPARPPAHSAQGVSRLRGCRSRYMPGTPARRSRRARPATRSLLGAARSANQAREGETRAAAHTRLGRGGDSAGGGVCNTRGQLQVLPVRRPEPGGGAGAGGGAERSSCLQAGERRASTCVGSTAPAAAASRGGLGVEPWLGRQGHRRTPQ